MLEAEIFSQRLYFIKFPIVQYGVSIIIILQSFPGILLISFLVFSVKKTIILAQKLKFLIQILFACVCVYVCA